MNNSADIIGNATPAPSVETDTAVWVSRYVNGIGWFGIAASITVLIGGWYLDIEPLKSFLPGWISMKANTALCFLFYSISLLQLTQAESMPKKAVTRWLRWLPLAGIAISSLTLLEHMLSLDFHIDQLLFHDPVSLLQHRIPGRMAPITATSLCLLGSSLWLGFRSASISQSIARIYALFALGLSFMSLLNYFYGVTQFNSLPQFFRETSAVHSALVGCLLSLACFAQLSRKGWIRIALSKSTSGLILRTLIPFFMIGIPGLQWLLYEAETNHLIAPEMQASIFVISILVPFALLTARLSSTLNRSEQAIQLKNQELEIKVLQIMDLNQLMIQRNRIFENALEGIAEINKAGQYISVNKAYAEMVGYRVEELIGQQWISLLPALEWDHAADLQKQLMQTGKAETEIRGRRKNDSSFYEQVVMVANYGELGEFIGHFQFTKDITDKKESERLLETAAQKFAAIFNQTFQFTGLMSPEGILLEANRSALESFGIQPEDVLDRPFWEGPWWRHSESLQLFLKEKIAEAAQNQFIRFETEHITQAGDMMAVDFSIKPITNEEGKVILLIPEGRDITDLKKTQTILRISEERLRMAIDCSQQGFWDWNEDPEKSYFDPGWYRVLKQKPDELDLSHAAWQNRVHPDDLARANQIIQEHIFGGAEHYEMEYRQLSGDNEWIWVRTHGRIVERNASGKPTRIIGMTQDISPQKETELILQQAKQEAEQASQFKSQFLANMSHEIRTPINGILGLTELTLNSELDEEQRDNLEMVYISGHSLLKIVNDILDFSKIEAGKIELDPILFEVRSSLREVVYPFITVAQKKQLNLEFEISETVPEYLVGDINKLRQILNNLLDNALKFTDNGTVCLKVWLDPLEAQAEPQDGQERQLHLLVEDTGIGLTASQKERIFAPFTQAESSVNRKYGGTGLGLSISRQLAILMNGKLWVDSEMSHGSHFHVQIKLSEPTHKPLQETVSQSAIYIPAPSSSTATQPKAPTVHGKAKRILLVEDNEINQKLAEHILRKAGYQVDWAINGEKALQQLKRQTYDLIVMDIHMPELDGFQTTELIRNQEKFSDVHIPIIALTADTVQGYRERCLAAGMDSYLTKPYPKEALLHEVALLLHEAPVLTSQHPNGESKREETFPVLNNVELLRKMLKPFAPRTEELLSRIQTALQAGDLTELVESTHALKGTLGNFTNVGAFQTVRQIESLARENQLETIPALLEQLKPEIEALRNSLEAKAR